MDSLATINIPEQGQLVEVRQRRFVVSEVVKSTLPPATLPGGIEQLQHLVSLTSVEDDALGEELEVIWELEPGAHAYDQVVLPEPTTGFDSPQRLDAFLDAVRWGAASSADVRSLQAPFRSGIDIEDYQLDPLVRAIQMPRVNLLIADDVGLGKTVESGLVMQELLIRHRARRILIVCPAALQIHWRDQMREKFGLEFRIVDSDLMKTLRRRRGIHVNPWTHFPRLITSIDFLKRERPMRLFREVLPAEGEAIYPRRFDLLAVDEAHNVAPSGRGRYATDSLRTAAIRILAPHFEHKLFLTATPHNGYAESFSALLELIDNQRFARGIAPDRNQLQAIMVRRLKSELPPRWDGTPRFPPRKLEAIEVPYTTKEKHVHTWLQQYSQLRRKNAATADEKFATEFVLKLLKKRLFSSPAAFAGTLEQHLNSLTSATPPATTQARLRTPSLGILRQQIARVEEEYAEDDIYEEATGDAVEASTRLFREPTPEEAALLQKMSAWAETASHQPDSKTQTLISWLHQHIKPNGAWADERVIIFTEYRTTQNWLQTMLAAQGFTAGDHLQTLYGGMDPEKREQVKAAFQAHPQDSPVRILLATDAASEGIDLQRHCHRLIHMEIPWNPNRLEQRNGRIDRHGQLHSPLVHHFVGKDYQQRQHSPDMAPSELEADLEFLMIAALKVEQIREDLGKVGPVIAEQVEAAMLGGGRHLYTDEAERSAEPIRRQLKFERNLRDQIEKLHDQLLESRHTLRLSPENVRAVVEIALELAGQPRLQPTEVEGIWPDPTGQRKSCPVFRLPPLKDSWARCVQGLAHPHTGEIRPIVFDHNLVRHRDDLVLVHLNHMLVQMSLHLLRAEVWSREGNKRLHRVTARLIPNHVLDTPALIAHARLVVIGGDSQRLHEEIITAGGEIREGRFRRMNVGQVTAALEAALPRQPADSVKQRLVDLWPSLKPSLVQSLEARMRDRMSGLEKFLADRADQETNDITAILQELARTIEAELTEPEYQQLELFARPEREQYDRNITALRHRLEQIPAEIEQETALIRARFADPEARLFPVAVTFLVPERLGQ